MSRYGLTLDRIGATPGVTPEEQGGPPHGTDLFILSPQEVMDYGGWINNRALELGEVLRAYYQPDPGLVYGDQPTKDGKMPTPEEVESSIAYGLDWYATKWEPWWRAFVAAFPNEVSAAATAGGYGAVLVVVLRGWNDLKVWHQALLDERQRMRNDGVKAPFPTLSEVPTFADGVRTILKAVTDPIEKAQNRVQTTLFAGVAIVGLGWLLLNRVGGSRA